MVKRLSAMRETWVWSLGWEDPLEKEMAAHSSILAWKIPWTEEPGRLQSMGSQRVGHDWAMSLSLSLLSKRTCVIPRWGLAGRGVGDLKCQVWEDESSSQQHGLPDYRATRDTGTNLASALSSCCSHQTCTHPSPSLPLTTPRPPRPPTPPAALSPLRW